MKYLRLPYPDVAGIAAAAPKLNPVVVEEAGAAAEAVEPKLNPFVLESSVLAAPPKENVDGEEVV